MKNQGHSEAQPGRARFGSRLLSGFCLLGCLLLVSIIGSGARPLVSTESPIGFFTNVAARLLRAEFDLDLNRIQLYPTNQYTPAVHRFLQLTANIYDATTKRDFNVLTASNGFPTVFRPLFRRGPDGKILIAGYREEVDASMAYASTAPAMVYLNTLSTNSIPPLGQPLNLNPGDRTEPMVAGFPLVIGAKKGFPNFNELGMETQVQVIRKLQFRRQNNSMTGPINETNEMYIVSITNTCGVEAWNSYRTPYPRPLQVIMSADMSAIVSNEFNQVITPVTPVNPMNWPMIANLPVQGGLGSWPAFTDANRAGTDGSFKAWTASFLFMTNMTFSETYHNFVPLTGIFERNVNPRFGIPYWLLKLQTRLRFILVDTEVNRIVDYVNLEDAQPPREISQILSSDGECAYPYSPDGQRGSLWCVNRLPAGGDEFAPTLGILNQIKVSLNDIYSAQWPIYSDQRRDEVDFFRAQFPFRSLLFHRPGTFPTTNIFEAPFIPGRRISFYTRWQANDPLVHYTVPDLTDCIVSRPVVELDGTDGSPIRGIGGTAPVNSHYRPWGTYVDSPDRSFGTDNNLSVKDPLSLDWITNPDNRGCSDNWDFPTNLTLSANWLGRVHRGTPWQTMYLKSPSVALNTWMAWTGDKQFRTNWDRGGTVTVDAASSLPTNDWHLASLLVSLLSTNDPHDLLSVNQAGVSAWSAALDGITVLTNAGATLVMSSNSPQAATIGTALEAARRSQPGQYFRDPGDILATPELSTASPWLDAGQTNSIPDAAYEAIPSQLLPRLRPDSIGSIVQSNGTVRVRFTGADDCQYVVEASTNLLNWAALSTNAPNQGMFDVPEALPFDASRRFYRSVLLP